MKVEAIIKYAEELMNKFYQETNNLINEILEKNTFEKKEIFKTMQEFVQEQIEEEGKKEFKINKNNFLELICKKCQNKFISLILEEIKVIYLSKISFFIKKLLTIYGEKEVSEILQIKFSSKAYFLKNDDIMSIVGLIGGVRFVLLHND